MGKEEMAQGQLGTEEGQGKGGSTTLVWLQKPGELEPKDA